MNSFGRIFRISVFGESHGPCIGTVIDGCPPGINLSENDFLKDLERRKPFVAGTTPRKEEDTPLIKSGVFKGKTTGAPITIIIENKNAKPEEYKKIVFTPRPGHTDFVAHKKFSGFNDPRGSGHFSGRLTAALVCAGVVAKKIVEKKIEARVTEINGSSEFEKEIVIAMKEKDSVGGIIECRVKNVPVGLGEPFFDSVESLISHAVFSVPAVKGIEFGSGFACTRMKGSECNDKIINASGKTETNNAGGINGGITNGNELVFRVAVKPVSSISKSQKTVNMKTGNIQQIEVKGRHDVCIAVRAPVIIEAVTACVLADLMIIQRGEKNA
jgi:chorismate synthase